MNKEMLSCFSTEQKSWLPFGREKFKIKIQIILFLIQYISSLHATTNYCLTVCLLADTCLKGKAFRFSQKSFCHN